jgi:hypothetical protein
MRFKTVSSLVLLLAILVSATPVHAAGTAGTGSRRTASRSRSKASKPARTAEKSGKPTGARRSREARARDSHGRIARSEEAKHRFEVQSGYPHGRRGFVVDHIVPLACGGADAPSNMQWQTVEQARAKDKVERRGCH